MLGADRSAGAAAVVDDELLAELLRQLRGERPRERVGAAAGRERRDEADRLVSATPAPNASAGSSTSSGERERAPT